MKILLVCQYYYPERFSVSTIAEGLVALGNDVTVVTSKPNYGFGKILEDYKKVNYEVKNGVKINRINVIPRKKTNLSIIINYLSFFFAGKRFLRKYKEKFDVVLSISLSPVISISPAILYAKRNKTPIALYCEDIWPESVVSAGVVKEISLMYKLLFKWSKRIYSNLDNIMISSPSFEQYFKEVLKLENKGYKVIYQMPLIAEQSEKPIQFANKFNLVYAGNIGKLQNIDLLLDGMKLVKTNDVKLHLLGIGSCLDNVKERIKNENLENVVAYEGAFPIEQVEAYVKNADALIITLKDKGYVGKTIPNKVIQYLKYGKPIIASIYGDGKNLLEKAGGSLICKENPQDLASKIDSLLEMDEKQKHQLCKLNSDFYNGFLDNGKIIKQIENELLLLKR